MEVTDKQYYMEDRLIQKLDLMCDRCTKKKFDNLIVFDGDEGYGKTTLSIDIAYYMAWKTNREFSVKNIFFDVDKLIEFARSTEGQIVLWDEAALGGLSDQFRNSIQTKLLQLLMVARKKRHIWLFNIPKFFKLREYIILDRAIALIHVYARNEIELGRFVYFSKKSKERLYYDFKRSKRRDYKKHYDFRGTFPDKLAELIDEKKYDEMKDKAILSIGGEQMNAKEIELFKIKYKISQMPEKLGISLCKFAELFETPHQTLSGWKKFSEKYPIILEK